MNKEDTKNVEVLRIDGKEYAVLEEFDHMVFTSNLDDPEDVKVFNENGDELTLLEGKEESEALLKFYQKYEYLMKDEKEE